MFVIEDESHAEIFDEFDSLDKAKEQLRLWAKIPWDEPPNRAPCTSWRTCGRSFEIVEYADPRPPYEVLSRVAVLEVSKAGVRWLA